MASTKFSVGLPQVPQIEIKIEGRWVEAQHLTDNLQHSIQSGYDKAIEVVANRILRVVKRSIKSGTPPTGAIWPALSPTTTRRYGEHDIYNLTGTYLRAIRLIKYRHRTYIGVPKGASASGDSKLSLNSVGIILEHGSKDGRIPPRPLWAPSYQASGGNRMVSAEILKQIRSSLQGRGINPRSVR